MVVAGLWAFLVPSGVCLGVDLCLGCGWGSGGAVFVAAFCCGFVAFWFVLRVSAVDDYCGVLVGLLSWMLMVDF